MRTPRGLTAHGHAVPPLRGTEAACDGESFPLGGHFGLIGRFLFIADVQFVAELQARLNSHRSSRRSLFALRAPLFRLYQ